MTITLTDMFCGAGGSSTGAIQVPGVKVRMAANHWKLACDVHNANHPDTDEAKKISDRNLVTLVGNAVTPPASRDLVTAVAESLEPTA